MQEITGTNLFDYWAKGQYIVITTNGTVKGNGCAVMGRGVALQAANQAKKLPLILGTHLRKNGNIPLYLPEYRLFTLPVKHDWWEMADLDLIIKSTKALKEIVEAVEIPGHIYLPRPGCGNGHLEWRTVKQAIAPILDRQFIIVERNLT